MRETRFMKAIADGFSNESTFENINESIKLAKSLEIIDVIDPTSKVVGVVAEIVSRLKRSEELEIMKLNKSDMVEA